MMNAGQRETAWINEALPVKIDENQEEGWLSYTQSGQASDAKLLKDWSSVVPGSLAPCHLIVAAIQCMRNKGYQVDSAERLIDDGLSAVSKGDGAALQVISANIYRCLNEAKLDPSSTYHQYKKYLTWQAVLADCDFSAVKANTAKTDFKSRIEAGWYGQLIGGALGTQVEGYTTDNIYKVYGEVKDYLRAPETYNDDITYEIAFLDAFYEKGYDIEPDDIAQKWLALISEGYSAEEVALRNLRNGVFPPLSGQTGNYYSDWIGAQMRTMVHGMAAPANPYLAATLAAKDSCISHANNGLIGGVFNAVLISLAFMVNDMRELVIKTLSCLPKESEFYAMADFALKACRVGNDWRTVWKGCEEKFIEYNWIHAYPNAAAEIVALWFGENDFDKTAFIITMCGLDVDCNAAPVLNALGVAYGMKAIPRKWLAPLGSVVKTTMRKYKEISVAELVEKTARWVSP